MERPTAPKGSFWHDCCQRPEALLVFAALFLCLGIWGFAEIADEVQEGETASVDRTLFLLFRDDESLDDPLGPWWVEEMARDVTALGGVAVLTALTLAVFIYLLLDRKPRTAVLMAVAVGGGVMVSSLLKSWFDRPRPDLVTHLSHVSSSSFPSGHSMMSAVTYLTIFTLLASGQMQRRLKFFFFGCAASLTMAVGVSRIYLGVHWPTDVLAGWTAGCVWALFAWGIVRLLPQLLK